MAHVYLYKKPTYPTHEPPNLKAEEKKTYTETKTTENELPLYSLQSQTASMQ